MDAHFNILRRTFINLCIKNHSVLWLSDFIEERKVMHLSIISMSEYGSETISPLNYYCLGAGKQGDS